MRKPMSLGAKAAFLTLAALSLLLSCASAGDPPSQDAVAAAKEYVNLGNEYYALKKFDKAIQCYRRALELDAELSGSALNLSRALIETGKYDEALSVLESLLKKEPDNTVLLSQKAYCLAKMGRYDEAAGVYERVAALSPDDLPTLYNLAVLKYGAGKKDEAYALFSRIAKLNPQDYDTLLYLALIELDSGKQGLAIEHLETYLAKKGKDAKALRPLARAYEAQRLYAKSLENWKALLSLAPDDPEALFECAFIYLTVTIEPELGLDSLKKALDKGYKDEKGIERLWKGQSLSSREEVKKALEAKGLLPRA
jgi:tetratricopeptide (TPR) repeat protein